MSTAEAQRTLTLLQSLDAAQDSLIEARIAAENNKPLDVAFYAEIAIGKLRAALVGIGGTS